MTLSTGNHIKHKLRFSRSHFWCSRQVRSTRRSWSFSWTDWFRRLFRMNIMNKFTYASLSRFRNPF
jgi:hypothetical protein